METPQATQVASVNLIVNLSPELSWFAKPLVDVNVADVELSTEAEDGAPPAREKETDLGDELACPGR